MKFDFKKNKKLIVSVSLSAIGLLSTISIFTVPVVLPNFPYKCTNVFKTIANTNANIQSYNNYASVDKDSKLSQLQDELNKAKSNSNNAAVSTDKLNVPVGVDYGSMMIFLQEKAAENYLQVLNINFEGLNSSTDTSGQSNANSNNNTNSNSNSKTDTTASSNSKANTNDTSSDNKKSDQSNTETPSNSSDNATYENIQSFSPKKVTVRVIGPYKDIQEYLEKIPGELGSFNYIDNIKMWKSQDTLAKQGSSSNDVNLFEDEKSIILEFDIVMYSKS